MEKLIQNLNQSQKEAVLCINSPLIIFAGAGTGKTRVITHRIAYLLSQGVAPQQILAVTFTNKAAAEMKRRVNYLAAGLGANVHISTFHSFCAYFLRIEASKINLNPDFVIYDFGEQKNVVKDCIKELNLDEKKFKPSYVTDRISRAKDDLKTPEDLAREAAVLGDFFTQGLTSLYGLYQKKLETAQALDFGDLILKTVRALKQYPALLEKYQDKCKYIMVDEYQDTNRAQYVLIKLIAQKNQNICVVGDDDQSVYGWRGADVNNILDFEKDYPNAKTVKLEQNYRSTPKILDTAYKVVKNNSCRIEKKLWTQNPDDGSLSLIKSKNENDEAAKVADIISLNAQNGKSGLSDFAVFYRTNAQSRVFEDAFRRAGMPYAVIGTLRFYDRAEIKDITAYLKLIHNPNDNLSLKRIINVPRRSIGKTSLENLERLALERNISIWQAIEFAPQAGLNRGAVKSLGEFATFINSFINLKKSENVKNITENVILRSGYLKELEIENSPESKTKIENIHELISAITDFEKRSPDKTLAGYLMQVALINDLDSIDDSKGKVTMMTLHLAKGLEFDNVFITGLEEGLFPVGESAFKPEELEEERRLMYVGMTRARKNLFLTWAAERTVYGKTKWNMLSRFACEAGFKDDFSDSLTQENQYFKNNHYAKNSASGVKGYSGKYQNFAKVQYKYKSEDSYDYIPSDDEIIKDEPLYVPAADSSPYNIGDFVVHHVFGKGKIIEKIGKGDDLKLVILFDNGQWKKLLAKVSNLEIITK